MKALLKKKLISSTKFELFNFFDKWWLLVNYENRWAGPLQTTNILVLIVFFMICICVSETNHNKKYCTTLIIMIKCTFVKKVLLLDCWQGRIQNVIIAQIHFISAKNIFFLWKKRKFSSYKTTMFYQLFEIRIPNFSLCSIFNFANFEYYNIISYIHFFWHFFFLLSIFNAKKEI